MIRLIIFGGTSEGYELTGWALDNGFSVILSVATDYGTSLCAPREGLTIKKGRMEPDEMKAFFRENPPSLIIDATHPHAARVSENIRAAAASCDLPLIRVVRPLTDLPFKDEYPDWVKSCVNRVPSAAEALECLKKDDRPVLLTTGSKEISLFSSLPGFADRVYARVLPESSALDVCEKAGLTGRHIIAMQGPFSTELNLALINSLRIGWFVTKESGQRGGFYEKAEAAAKSGTGLIIIERPQKEEGLSIAEAEEKLRSLKKSEEETDPVKTLRTPEITLTGLGMGGGSQLTLEALKALSRADIVFGAPRMLEDIRPYAGDKPLIPLYKAEEIYAFLNDHPGYERACVVFSGDTGFYSGSAAFGHGDNIHILPGISSFSCLCARFGLKEEEFTPASAHGRDVDAAGLLLSYSKVFLLLDGQNTVGAVCSALTGAGYGDTHIYAGVRLGYPDEEVFCGRAKDLTDLPDDELAVMAMEREDG